MPGGGGGSKPEKLQVPVTVHPSACHGQLKYISVFFATPPTPMDKRP
jgi:hypothetical protein